MKHFHALFKYVVSGGSSAVVNVGVLYLLTEYAHIHYLVSAVISFVFGFFISFLLQKFWTFQDRRKEGMHRQMAWYLLLSLANLFLNTTLIYLFVEYAHFWYVAAAVVTGALLAISNFFIYKHVIFAIDQGREIDNI
jgi:putative flippase GtrA